MKLALLPGGVAVHPDQVLYLRAAADTAQGGDAAPHSVFLRIQGFNQPAPLARHPNRAAAEAAIDALTKTIDAAADGEAEMTRLPRGISVKNEEMVFVEVIREKVGAGDAYVVRTKLESEDRPVELASFPQAGPAIELAKGCGEALGDEFLVLPGGVTIRDRKVQRTEVVADRAPDGSLLFKTVVKCQSEARRLTVTVERTREAAEAAAQAVIDKVNTTADSDEALVMLGRGTSARPDGIKGLRVRAQRVTDGGVQKTVFRVVLLTDDDEEQAIDVVETPDAAEALIKAAVAAFNAAADDDEDDWD